MYLYQSSSSFKWNLIQDSKNITEPSFALDSLALLPGVGVILRGLLPTPTCQGSPRISQDYIKVQQERENFFVPESPTEALKFIVWTHLVTCPYLSQSQWPGNLMH